MSQPSAVCYEPEECAWCIGRGRERERTCAACKGRGAVLVAQPARPCRSCAGTGRDGLIERRAACAGCGGVGWDGLPGRQPAAPAVDRPPAVRMSDRRNSPRAPLMLPVTWCRSGEQPRQADTGDLSLGGCFVMTSEPAAVGERVIVTLPCEATAGLRVTGDVAYRMEIGFGVRFAVMPDAARVALTTLLSDYYRALERAGLSAPGAGEAPAPHTTPLAPGRAGT